MFFEVCGEGEPLRMDGPSRGGLVYIQLRELKSSNSAGRPCKLGKQHHGVGGGGERLREGPSLAAVVGGVVGSWQRWTDTPP